MESTLKNVKKNDQEESADEVDSVLVSNKSTNKKDSCKSCGKDGSNSEGKVASNECNKINNNNLHQNKKTSKKSQQSEEAPVKSQSAAMKALNIFNLSKFHKRNDNKDKDSDNGRKQQFAGQRLIRSSSIAKLLGNGIPLLKNSDAKETALRKSHSVHERFSKRSEDVCENDYSFSMRSLSSNDNLLSRSVSSLEGHQWNPEIISSKKLNNFDAIKTLTRNFGKLLRKNYDSVSISVPDPEYKVSYLGNVLTAWSKGESCMEKPLATLWKNYTQNKKPEVLMRLKVCPSGLKATTRQHGLTEYWSHRITFCAAPSTYPKVFCWIYRHEGRKMKHELRCHAVICSRDSQCQDINLQLKDNLEIALREFKKDKINKQNARLSLAHAAEENPSMPRRKIMLSTGAHNYRPPLERSKSAPKLFAIEEMVDEEDEEDLDENGKLKRSEQRKHKDMIRTCCLQGDHLYPSITLGRRRCRRGHSIRRPRLYGDMKAPPKLTNIKSAPAGISTKESIQCDEKLPNEKACQSETQSRESEEVSPPKPTSSDEDFEDFLRNQNYNTKDYLTGDMISYFDSKLNNATTETNITDPVTCSMSDLLDNDDFTLNDHQRNSISMNDLNNFHYTFESDGEDDELHENRTRFDQDSILQTLFQRSQENFGEFDSPSESLISDPCHSPVINECRNMFILKRPFVSLDNEESIETEIPSIAQARSDDSLIVSGCDVATLITVSGHENISDSADDGHEYLEKSDKPIFRSGSVLDRVRNFEMLATAQFSEKEPSKNVPMNNNNLKNFNRIQANLLVANNRELNLVRRMLPVDNSVADGRDKNRDDESEMSDESGFVEFQDLSLKSMYA